MQVLKQISTGLRPLPKQTTLIEEIHQLRLLQKKGIVPILLQNQTQIKEVIQLLNLIPAIRVIIQEAENPAVEVDPQEVQIEEV